MNSLSKQSGVVAIIVGICIFFLLGFLALVIDLGQLYIGKTLLQNAADSAALAGAKKLKGTSDSVEEAVNEAISVFGAQNFGGPRWNDPGNINAITANDIWVGSCPGDLFDDADPTNNDGCMVPVSEVISGAEPANDKYFLKVHTRHRDIDHWIWRAWGIGYGENPTATYANAVAGPFMSELTPIGVCCIDKALPECGFQRGVAYNLSEHNKSLGQLGSGTFLWLDPLATSPDTCDSNHGSTNFFYPFLCSGRMGSVPAVNAYTNTGQFSTPHEKNLNSRFGDAASFSGGNSCNASTAPPDSNVVDYSYQSAVVKAWMNPDPTRQTLLNSSTYRNPIQYGEAGVLWAFSRPKDTTVADWKDLYPTVPPSPPASATNYPEPSPYVSGGGNDRRVLNLVMVECPNTLGAVGAKVNGSCDEVNVVSFGQFFMQVHADSQGNPKRVDVEFGGLISTGLDIPVVRLYR
jgi:hypothetical protein